jgi:Relaxase/Mobilisation nuclease domain
MKKRIVDLRGSEAAPILDIVSYGRSVGVAFTPTQRMLITRTVARTPEVMVKVSGGARTPRGVAQHLDYIGRKGDLGVELDTGEQLQGKNFDKVVVQDWDLDLEAHRRQDYHSIRGRRKPPKLVHNIIFSMPPGTSSKKVLTAVRKLATREFALKHRYAMVLHTDDAHPHVHLVVKAMSEQGRRLNIRKAILRDWRQQFAAYLREQGVAANATERAVRGETKTRKSDGLFRAMQRNVSVRQRMRLIHLAADVSSGTLQREQGKAVLMRTREQVVAGWLAVSERLQVVGDSHLAGRIQSFVARMPPVRSEKEMLFDVMRASGRDGKIKPSERTR